MSTVDKEELVQKAKLAEQSERYVLLDIPKLVFHSILEWLMDFVFYLYI